MKKPFVISIVGPTSSGKTGFSIELAKKLKKIGINPEIVSADSRQVYKGLDLLSGKVTKKEMSGVPHHMLDVANPKKTYSVSLYKKDAERKINEILSRGNLPIIVGGTGFYIDAITKGVVLPQVAPDKNLRDKLSNKTEKELFSMLKKLDKNRAETIDFKNKVRLIRAIEIANSIGKVPKTKSNPRYEVETIYLDLEDGVLKEKIKQRIISRIKSGMIKEAENLHKKGLSWKRMEGLGLECRFVSQYLQGKISKQEMIESLEKATWQYVKRQRTWFKR